MNNPERIRALIIERSEDAALSIVESLDNAGVEMIWRRVDDAETLRRALIDPWDIVISDYGMPLLSAKEAMRIVHEIDGEIAFIVVSGVVGEESAVELMRAGARDYVMKDRLERLLPAIKREVGETSVRRQRALAMVGDVTLRRESEQTMRRQKEQLEEAQRIAHLGSWWRDLSEDVIEWSDEMYRIFGVERGSVSTTTGFLMSAVIAEDREPLAAMIARAARERVPTDIAYRIERPDGTRRFLRSYGEITCGDDGIPRTISGVTQDVTESVLAAAANETLNRHVQLLLQSTTQGIFGMDSGGRCTFVNRAAAETLGYRPEELIGSSIHELIHPNHTDATYPGGECAITATARCGAACEMQADKLWRHDGTMLPVEYSAAPINDSGAILGVVVAFTDVSERKLMQAQLEQVERLSSLGRLAATIAHEFNNVLMGIQPFAELLSRQSEEGIQRSSQNILQAVRRGRSLTQEILGFTKPFEPVKETFDAAAWLRSLADPLNAILGSGIRLDLRTEGHHLLIRGDRHQLQQVLTNLAVNARDAMRDHGTLSILVERCRSGQMFPFGAIRTVDMFLHLQVTDSGSGMDAETLKHIFDPFFTTKRSGTGLGLAVVHQMIQLHGGSIFAESANGRGTEFHIFLPLAEEAFMAAAPALPVASWRRVGSVLLVEDDEAVATGVAILLRDAGVIVEMASTGALALASLGRRVPDAVILDLGLPDIGGRDLYVRIATAYPRLPVIFASGDEDDELLRPFLENKHVASLTKPYEFDSLLAVLSAITSPDIEHVAPAALISAPPELMARR